MRPSRQRRDYHTLSAQGFRFYFTPLKGVLFTFPSRYLFTIGHQRVFSLSRWACQIQTEFHVFRSTWDTTRWFQDFVHGPFTLCGKTFQNFTLSINTYHIVVPQPQHRNVGLGYTAFVRHYLRYHGCFLFLQVLRCFTSLSFAPHTLCIQVQVSWVYQDGFPHSEISGSKCICHSPKLIAAYHVLHRHLMPRHSPCAFCNLTKSLNPDFTRLLIKLYLPFLCNYQRTRIFMFLFKKPDIQIVYVNK